MDILTIETQEIDVLYIDQMRVAWAERLFVFSDDYEVHLVDGSIWETLGDIPFTLADALREGNLEAAQPVSGDEMP